MLPQLKKYFGYDHFRPIQEEVIQTVLNKTDCLLLMPTGGGKSICFQLPALMMEGTCLVISPLIALMKDQVMQLRSRGIASAFLNSSLSAEEEESIVKQAVNGDLKLIYLSPEKALRLPGGFYHALKVSFIAIDEAHCISNWGHDFRPEYKQLNKLRQLLPEASVIALTATADKVTREDILQQLVLREPKIFIASFDRPNLSLKVMAHLREKDKMKEIFQVIRRYDGSPGIIYCLSRKGTEKVCAALTAAGIKAGCYHAGMGNEVRSAVQEAFSRNELQVVCATIAFGMGIDKSNIRYVIHFNLPKNMEGYYQEIGRAGRDGLPSQTILFYGLGDLRLLREFAANSERKEYNLEKLRFMQEYAESGICRRRILLNYFSEHATANCGNCDVCCNPPQYMDGTELAQKALSALVRMNEKAGITLLIQVLRGSKQAEVLEKGFDRIKTYGAGADLPYDAWKSYVMQFIQTGLLEIAYRENYNLRLTSYGRTVLSGKLSVFLVRYEENVRIKKSPLRKNEETGPAKTSLFDALRKLRMDLSRQEKIPPYMIFSDHTLMMMDRFQPVMQEAFLQLPGVSDKKLAKYGEVFTSCILTHCEKYGFAPPPEPKIHFQVNELKGYLSEMKSADSKLTHRHMINLLLANGKTDFTEKEKQLSFFGKLKDRSTVKALREPIKNFFIAYVDTPVHDLAETFFAPPFYNRTGEINEAGIFRQIRQFPIQRPSSSITNDYILEQRKTYPRAYEPWSEEELKLYEDMLEHTNDLNFLCRTFQRNPGSMKQVFKKLKAGQAEMET